MAAPEYYSNVINIFVHQESLPERVRERPWV